MTQANAMIALDPNIGIPLAPFGGKNWMILRDWLSPKECAKIIKGLDEESWQEAWNFETYGSAYYTEIGNSRLDQYHKWAGATNQLVADTAPGFRAKFHSTMEGIFGLPLRSRNTNIRERLGRADLPDLWTDFSFVRVTGCIDEDEESNPSGGVPHADFEGLSGEPWLMLDPNTRAFSVVATLEKSEGGDLRFWDRRYTIDTSPEIPWIEGTGMDTNPIPEVEPQILEYSVGSLAIFDSFCYHQITPSQFTPKHNRRLTAVCHLLYRADPIPHLEYWF